MSKSEIVSKIIEVLKVVDEKDYYYMVSAFGSEEVCKKYIQDSLRHPDMIINLLQGARRKSENKTINAEINQLIKYIDLK